VPIEAERALPSPISMPPLAAEESGDDIGIGAGEVGPRRRRRRGGRGRRTGLGGVGESDLQTEALQEVLDDTDEGDGTEEDRASASASTASPDDIDNAVLQLLASRDREPSPTSVGEVSGPETFSPTPYSTPARTPDVEERSRPPRRVARTSFSSFGPPESPIRPGSLAPAPTEPATPSNSEGTSNGSDTGEHSAPAAEASDVIGPDLGSVTQGLVPDAVVTEDVPVEPVDDAAFPQLAPVSAETIVEAIGPTPDAG